MSLKTSLAVATTAIGLTILASPAQAAIVYNFTYDNGLLAESKIIVTGTLTGSVSGDILTVNGFSNLVYNNSPVSSATNWTGSNTVVPFYPIIGGTPFAPSGAIVASFSGSSMNFVLPDLDGINYVGFGTGDGTDPLFDSYLVETTTSPLITGDLEGVSQAFNVEGWTLTTVYLPEPGAVVGLLGLGLGALASKVRKKG